jgi:hypothetical protein
MPKLHRFCATSRAEPQAEHTLAARYPSNQHSGGCPMTNLKLRALPYAGVLTLVASMAGYIGTR